MGWHLTGHGRNANALKNCLQETEAQQKVVLGLDTKSLELFNTLSDVRDSSSGSVSTQAGHLGVGLYNEINGLRSYRSQLADIQQEIAQTKTILERMELDYKLPRAQRVGQRSGNEIVQDAQSRVHSNRVLAASVYGGLSNRLSKYGINL